MAGYQTRNSWGAPDKGWPSFDKDGKVIDLDMEDLLLLAAGGLLRVDECGVPESD